MFKEWCFEGDSNTSKPFIGLKKGFTSGEVNRWKIS